MGENYKSPEKPSLRPKESWNRRNNKKCLETGENKKYVVTREKKCPEKGETTCTKCAQFWPKSHFSPKAATAVGVTVVGGRWGIPGTWLNTSQLSHPLPRTRPKTLAWRKMAEHVIYVSSIKVVIVYLLITNESIMDVICDFRAHTCGGLFCAGSSDCTNRGWGVPLLKRSLKQDPWKFNSAA